MDEAVSALRERVLAAVAGGTQLCIRGAGTKDFLGEFVVGERLDTTTLDGVIAYEPTELVLTARAGTRLSVIEALLAERGQMLAFEPPRFGGDPTIGGVIAAGLSGPRRAQVGAARDFVLGAHLLDGQGQLLRFGGQVMKNVAGFDVARLLCGSLGILGVLTQVSVKVLPRPAAEATLCLEMNTEGALAAFARWAARPLPISATMHANGRAWVRLSGAVAAVSKARETLGGDVVPEAEAAAHWAALRDQTAPFFAGGEPLWRVSAAATTPMPVWAGATLVEWGGALRWHRTAAPLAEIRAWAAACGGSAWQWRGGEPGQRQQPLDPAALTIHQRLKLSFDPAGVFNAGRLVPGL